MFTSACVCVCVGGAVTSPCVSVIVQFRRQADMGKIKEEERDVPINALLPCKHLFFVQHGYAAHLRAHTAQPATTAAFVLSLCVQLQIAGGGSRSCLRRTRRHDDGLTKGQNGFFSFHSAKTPIHCFFSPQFAPAVQLWTHSHCLLRD